MGVSCRWSDNGNGSLIHVRDRSPQSTYTERHKCILIQVLCSEFWLKMILCALSSIEAILPMYSFVEFSVKRPSRYYSQ